MLAFMKQRGEAGFRLTQKVGLAGSQELGAQSLYLTAKATMQVFLAQSKTSQQDPEFPAWALQGLWGRPSS